LTGVLAATSDGHLPHPGVRVEGPAVRRALSGRGDAGRDVPGERYEVLAELIFHRREGGAVFDLTVRRDVSELGYSLRAGRAGRAGRSADGGDGAGLEARVILGDLEAGGVLESAEGVELIDDAVAVDVAKDGAVGFGTSCEDSWSEQCRGQKG